MNSVKYFLQATRPKTLAACIVPVIIASSLAHSYSKFNFSIALIILVCALLIQIITNYINEIYDFKRGVDTEERLGPRRSVASGLISVRAMRNVSLILILVTFLIGLILVSYRDLNVLWIGIISLLFAYLYTGGPYPIAYNGFSDIFVFLFFGIIAVCGSFYIFTGEVNLLCLLASLPPGFLSSNILGVNNYRDIDTDAKANKKTLAIRIGKKNSLALYFTLTAFSYASVFLIYLKTDSIIILLPFLTLPYAFYLCRELGRRKGIELNNILAGTGKLLFIFGILLSLGFLIYDTI